MRKLSNTFAMTLAGAAMLLASACSSSSPGKTTGTGGTGGGSGIPLTPNATGFVSDPTSGILGAWYSYGDGAGGAASITTTDSADSDCIKKGGFTAAQCSQINTPTPGMPFVPDPTMGMCTSGTAAKVLPPPGNAAGSPDYSDLFGAGIGLDLNNPGGDAGVKMPIDLSTYKGFSFTFSGSMIPIGNKIRVNFPFMGENNGTDSPYFAANKTDDHSTISTTAVNVVHWSDILGPAYLLSQTPMVTPPPFDPTKVESIQFQVFTNTGAAIPYAFCVNNLTLLTE
jgi:hypothetical protein